MAVEWSFADLEPAQIDLIQEAERTLGTDVVMAYKPSRWGSVDPDAIGDACARSSSRRARSNTCRASNARSMACSWRTG